MLNRVANIFSSPTSGALLILGYVAVSVFWYLPRTLRRAPDGNGLRLSLGGQNLLLGGVVLSLVTLGDLGEPHSELMGLFLPGFWAGAVLGLLAVASWTRQWRIWLKEKGRIESELRPGMGWPYWLIAIFGLLEPVAERQFPPLGLFRALAFSSADGFLVVSGTLLWLWAARKERLTKAPVERFWRKL